MTKWIGVTEAAHQMGKSYHQVHRLALRGEIPARFVDGKLRVQIEGTTAATSTHEEDQPMSDTPRERKIGRGDIAIAKYVRAHHPEILERVFAAEQARQAERMAVARAKMLAGREAKKQQKVDALLAQLATLGIVVGTHEATVAGPDGRVTHVLNGARF